MGKEILNPSFYDENGKLLPELRKFNWGACIFGWIWGIFNKSYLTFLILLAFFPNLLSLIAGLVLPLWFGVKGNEWAIENKKWTSVEYFQHVQRIWAICAAVITLAILIPLIIAYAFFIMWVVNNPEKAQEIIMQLGLTL